MTACLSSRSASGATPCVGGPAAPRAHPAPSPGGRPNRAAPAPPPARWRHRCLAAPAARGTPNTHRSRDVRHVHVSGHRRSRRRGCPPRPPYAGVPAENGTERPGSACPMTVPVAFRHTSRAPAEGPKGPAHSSCSLPAARGCQSLPVLARPGGRLREIKDAWSWSFAAAPPLACRPAPVRRAWPLAPLARPCRGTGTAPGDKWAWKEASRPPRGPPRSHTGQVQGSHIAHVLQRASPRPWW